MKTEELTGAALDWAVAKCEGIHLIVDFTQYKPSTDWAQGGPITERENMGVKPNIGYEKWSAQVWRNSSPISTYGPTPLIAAMRCYVASKLGEEVEVPDGLA